MTLLYLSHPECLAHEMLDGHPERPDRLRALHTRLEQTGLITSLTTRQATPAGPGQLRRVHESEYLTMLEDLSPPEAEDGLVAVDPDTAMNSHSLNAARLASGAVIEAVDTVLKTDTNRAFCAVRPPGHHAEAGAAMGFCFYNSVAVGAAHALDDGNLDRVAVMDFDVHHGNGTVDIFKDRPEVLVCSSFQHPYYPHRYADIQRPNIVNTPLASGTGGDEFRRRIEADWLPALAAHRPQLILVSAGFDAHTADPLANLNLDESDFRWVTQLLVDAAVDYCDGRIVSTLEGGYDLGALARSAHTHLEVLLGG